mgnify:CR=1 FL=1
MKTNEENRGILIGCVTKVQALICRGVKLFVPRCFLWNRYIEKGDSSLNGTGDSTGET